MFNDFLIFIAPFLVIIAAFILSFWVAKNDKTITDDADK